MAAIVDVQGFKDQHNKFIVKELAFLTSENNIQHFIFQSPFKFANLTPTVKRQVNWLKRNLHGFGWDDGYIVYPHLYTTVPPLLFERIIYVKGSEKVRWVKDFLGKHTTVLDIETELQCPKLSWLRFHSHENMSCMAHNGQCALQNVFAIRNYLVNRKRPE